MAKANKNIRFKLVPSKFERTEGKYTGVMLAVGSIDDAQLEEIAAKNHLNVSPEGMRNIIRGYAEILKEYLTNGYTCQTPSGNWMLAISGSVGSMDAYLVQGVNEMYPTFVESQSLRAKAAALVPYEVSETDGIVMEAVEDLSTHKKGVIKGTQNFVVTGKRLSVANEGETMALLAPNGDAIAVTIVEQEEDKLGQRIIARLADAPAAGQYRLRLHTRGYGTPTADVVTLMKSVTVE